MKTKLITVILVLVAALGLGSSVQAQKVFDWHEANSFGWADKNNQKHPVRRTLGVLIPEKNNNSSGVCIWYDNNHAKVNKGKVTVKCELTRQDMSVEKIKFSKNVRDGRICECKDTGAVQVGDILMCSFTMKKFAKLKATEDDWNYVDIASAIVPGDRNWCN